MFSPVKQIVLILKNYQDAYYSCFIFTLKWGKSPLKQVFYFYSECYRNRKGQERGLVNIFIKVKSSVWVLQIEWPRVKVSSDWSQTWAKLSIQKPACILNNNPEFPRRPIFVKEYWTRGTVDILVDPARKDKKKRL